MEIEKGEIITLDDGKEYICFGRAIAENQKKYLYLMSTFEPIEIRFGEEIIDDSGVRIPLVAPNSSL